MLTDSASLDYHVRQRVGVLYSSSFIIHYQIKRVEIAFAFSTFFMLSLLHSHLCARNNVFLLFKDASLFVKRKQKERAEYGTGYYLANENGKGDKPIAFRCAVNVYADKGYYHGV